jgi:hypothetical protein
MCHQHLKQQKDWLTPIVTQVRTFLWIKKTGIKMKGRVQASLINWILQTVIGIQIILILLTRQMLCMKVISKYLAVTKAAEVKIKKGQNWIVR